ncbi:hypothetical protein DI383_14365 [Flavobacteriaceae bacterium LYZ1037]|nr:hypothetical protein DI383_14365 [Flavobacteriaceae bacterium LYZ1037]
MTKEDITKKTLAETLIKVNKYSLSRHEKYFSWLKNILTISVGLLGILVSLNSDKITDLYTFISFISTILFLGLGILFGAILLYNEVYIQSQLLNHSKKNGRRLLDGKGIKVFSVIRRHWFFSLSEIICLSSYLISLISLITYSIFKVYDKGILM